MNAAAPPSHRRYGKPRRRRRCKRQQRHDVVSTQYDRSRIEKELEAFFECDDEDAMFSPSSPSDKNDNNKSSSHVQNPLLVPLYPYTKYGKKSSISSSSNLLDQNFDPVFNLDPNASSSAVADSFNFLSIMEEDENERGEEPARSNKPNSQKQRRHGALFRDQNNNNNRSMMKISTSSDGDNPKEQEQQQQQQEQQQEQQQSKRPRQAQKVQTPSSSKQHYESDIDGFSIVDDKSIKIREMKKIISHTPNQFTDRPPELLTISMDSISVAPSHKTSSTESKSHISYDESTAMTPSVYFFLNANKDELQKEGLSIAGGNDNDHASHSVSPTAASTSRADWKEGGDDESQTARGYSRGSSKYTTDSARIIELRERKRLIERSHERKYNAFPALIEVDKFLSEI